MPQELKSPFPWFGGKSRAAKLIWSRLGDVPNYVEPFAGSLAVLMRRPTEPGNEIVNDLNCYVANAWRATKMAPKEVAGFCDWPVNEADLHARHRWLRQQSEFRARMENEPEFYDAKIAGWWIWGLSCWIGNGFCSLEKNLTKGIPYLGSGGGGQGVSRKVPWLRLGGGGVQNFEEREQEQCENLVAWFDALANRLRFTKVVCGDWTRVLTKAATYGQGLTGVLLDPPYDTDGHYDVYGDLSRGVAGPVREWAIANGNNPLLRIALCGYEGEHKMPTDWDCVPWKANGGYASAAGNTENAARERIWFSPACLQPQPELF